MLLSIIQHVFIFSAYCFASKHLHNLFKVIVKYVILLFCTQVSDPWPESGPLYPENLFLSQTKETRSFIRNIGTIYRLFSSKFQTSAHHYFFVCV